MQSSVALVPAGEVSHAAGTVNLCCGSCGAQIARAVLPPAPPFASLPFELRTLLRPLLTSSVVLSKLPSALALVIRAYVAGKTPTVAELPELPAALAMVTRCPLCDDA